MYSGFFAIVIFIVAVGAVYLGARLLAKTTWILGWLRGMVGLSLIALAVLITLVGLDLFSYKQLLDEKPLLTISFEKQGEQAFEAKVDFVDNGQEQSFVIKGDQWQVDARIIRWLGLFQVLGAKPGYRLDRISGRYYSLEDERREKRSVYQLSESEYGLDMWHFLRENGRYVPIVDAVYGSATYLPMEHGAIFQISLSSNGLTAKPLNSIADGAINRWQ
ncbi:MAG: hypothetical protein ACI9Y1_001028 [Lentisphaeria bacterium]|jgi:hypothetical protein